jgi:phage tail-like protein
MKSHPFTWWRGKAGLILLGLAMCFAVAPEPRAVAAEDPLLGYSFALEVEGTTVGFFTGASGIGSLTEVTEQSINTPASKTGTSVKKLPGRLRWNEVVLRRGITEDMGLWEWRQQVVDGDIDEARKNFSIIILDESLSPVARWEFVNGWPSKIEAPHAGTGTEDMALESLSLVYEQEVRCPDPLVPCNPANNPPTISDIPDKQTYEDTPVTVNFTVNDRETPLNNLQLTSRSSNATLVPQSRMTLGGSGANRTLTILPAANLSGSALVTVTVSDGTYQKSDSFSLTVTPVNDRPVIRGTPPRTVAAFSRYQFTPTAVDVEGGVLTFSIINCPDWASFDTATGSLSGTPVTVHINTATTGVEISVTDPQGAKASLPIFSIAVTDPPNHPPTISTIEDQRLSPNSSTRINFTVEDRETSAQSLVISLMSSNTRLLPLANLSLGGSGTNRTLDITPARNQTGSAIITITVSDGFFTTSLSFTVTVA